MAPRAKTIREKLFANKLNDWQTYHKLIGRYLRAGMTVLDVGCGRGSVAPFSWNEYLNVKLIGLDPDPTASGNPHLETFILLPDEQHWPIEDGSIDMVLARYVLEHVVEPDAFFNNVHRVLKSKGIFAFLTPNQYHFATIISRITPHSWKGALLSRTKGCTEGDVFPTLYRLNSLSLIGRLAQKFNLKIEHLATNEFMPCGYFDFCLPGFLVCYAYYLVVTRTGLEHYIGASITGVLRKA